MTGPIPADYDAWNEEKKAIQSSTTPPVLFKEREVWWCSLGVNIGSEQNGDTQQHNGQPATFRRPVLVLRKISYRACVVLPLTTQGRTESWYYPLDVRGRQSWALLVQIRHISALRLTKRIFTVPEPEFEAIRRACRTELGL